MRFRSALACAALCLLGCASPVRLEGYRAAYSTHFEGLPDQAETCALVRNQGARAVDWVELRLRSSSHFGGDTVIRSKWLYRGRIEAGETVALRLLHPPVADRIAVSHVRAGNAGSLPEDGRPMERAKDCSDAGLRAALEIALRGRTAPGIELFSANGEGDSWVAAP
jgi:hypothetical protein